jgi:hypothetical protein
MSDNHFDPEREPRLALPGGSLRGPDGQPFEVPPEGALGLLALGWEGLRLWRAARRHGGWKPAEPVSEKQPEQQA